MKKTNDKLTSTVLKTVKDFQMNTDSVIIIGLSGGADSSLLLHLLPLFHKGKTVAVHVNHGIRGEQADNDEKFCIELCSRLGVSIEIFHLDIPSVAERSGKGLEEAGRDARRECFVKVAEKYGADTLALAHNASDSAETLIFNLARGTGLRGLCGIKPVGTLGKLRIIRPLIRIDKADITSYCERNSIDYVTDATNADNDYTRNYIRHEILPRLSRINSSYLSNICSVSDRISECEDYIGQCAKASLPESGRIKTADIALLPAAITSELLYELYGKAGGSELESRHIGIIREFCGYCTSGKRLNLPGRVFLICDGDEVFFTKKENIGTDSYIIPIKEGVNEISGYDTVIICRPANSINSYEYINIYNLLKRILISSDIIMDNIFIRARRADDTIHYGNMTHSITKLLSERKIPVDKRKNYPVVCDKSGVLWVPPFSPRDNCRGDEAYELLYCQKKT